MNTAFEFSRPLALEQVLPHKPRQEDIAATADECAALAARFDLKSLSVLQSRMTLTRTADSKLVRVAGALHAELVQTCVVSLQDVPAVIDASFETYFTEDGEEFDEDAGLDIELEEDEFPVGGGGVVDLGELAAQYLSLEIDPYPRAPGVSLAAQMAATGDEGKNRPFEILRGLTTDAKED